MTTSAALAPTPPPPRSRATESICTLVRQQAGQNTVAQRDLQHIANVFFASFNLPELQVLANGVVTDWERTNRARQPDPHPLQLTLCRNLVSTVQDEIRATYLGDGARTQLDTLAGDLLYRAAPPTR